MIPTLDPVALSALDALLGPNPISPRVAIIPALPDIMLSEKISIF